jgi:hypothetical protein
LRNSADGSGFVLGRKPMAKRMRTKLREIKEKLMATRHDGIDWQGQWLAASVDVATHEDDRRSLPAIPTHPASDA